MSQVYITVTRTDIPNGVLQIRDLYPNPSDFNAVIDPYPQGPFYLSQPGNESVATKANGNILTLSRTVSGLAAYLIATISGAQFDGPDGDILLDDDHSLTASEANTIANAIIATMQSSGAVTTAAINTIIQNNTATAVANGIGLRTSTGKLADILAILTGAVFTLPAGHQVQDTNGLFTAIGTNDIDDYFIGEKNNRILASDIAVSAAKGALSVMLSDNFTYKGIANNCVAIYNSNGSVYDPNA
jgi:hypothetical protein